MQLKKNVSCYIPFINIKEIAIEVEMQDDNLKRLNEKNKSILIIFVYKTRKELIIFKLYYKYKRKYNISIIISQKKMNVSIRNRYEF